MEKIYEIVIIKEVPITPNCEGIKDLPGIGDKVQAHNSLGCFLPISPELFPLTIPKDCAHVKREIPLEEVE